jgi:diaminopimelate decarboxylase
MAPYLAAYERVAELIRALRLADLAVERVDCGGGLGIPYRAEPAATPEALAGAINRNLGGLRLSLMIEPGRWLVGPAGVLLTSVILVKQAIPRRFVVLDAAMNDLIRPAMYDAWHAILPTDPVDAVAPLSAADVVGPVCETGDTFATNRDLPSLKPGARLAILDCGAYGSVMSSTYNARPLAAQVLVAGHEWSVIRRRQTLSSLWEAETMPEFLQP